MRSLKRASLPLLVLLFAVYACDLSTLNLTGPNTEATMLAQTLAVFLTGSPPAATSTPQPATPTQIAASVTPTSTVPTSTLTATLTPTPTVTPYFTPTAIPILTPTPVVPSIRVSVPTNCRVGPGIPYDIDGALLVGEMAQVLAVDPTRSFWYIPNPDSPGDYCWVWGQYATISGPTLGLPVYTPPPTPIPTITSTPSPDFEFSFDGLVGCSPSWWPQFRIKNTGQISFQSVGLTVKDTTADTSASVISDNFYDQVDCSTSNSRAQLLPGKAVTVSPVSLGYDPSGHKLKVTVTLCSQDGQNGLCETETLSVTP